MKDAIIIFTRVPIPHKTKTRLMPVYTPEECAALHSAFLRDIYTAAKKTNKTIFVFYTPDDAVQLLAECLGTWENFFVQEGADLGARMLHAIQTVLQRGFSSCVLIGSDIPEMSAEIVQLAFSALDKSDIVLCPVSDGGYCLIGMKKIIREAFDIPQYGTATVLENTVRALKEVNYTVSVLPVLHDIDTLQDMLDLMTRLKQDPSIPCTHTRKYLNAHKKISVIIPIYNEAEQIIKLQHELKKLSDCEIIFADGGSTDNTLSLIEKQYTVIQTKKGRAFQMNEGARQSSGAILFFLHADSMLPRNAAEKIRTSVQRYRFGCFRISFTTRNLFFTVCAFMSNVRARVLKIPFGDQGIFVERNVFFESGGFPELPIMEDYQFSRNMKRKKEKLGVAKATIITSARRYGNSFLSQMRTARQMFYLQFLYRRGKNIEEIAAQYKDIRNGE
ncbi:MAG: TIGR04283 family arsenosugar biosynthesis glycosyltransferase [Treponemataceae bacterium]